MTNIHPGIFKKYDIRGIAEGEKAVLSPEVARVLGRGIGTYMQRYCQRQQVVSGYDNRHTSHDLQLALHEGLVLSGCDVIDIGLVSTPLVYWHSVQHNSGGIMVTGSHLSPEYNGFKLCVGRESLFGSHINIIARIIQEENYTHGHGKITVDEGAYSSYIHDIEKRIPMSRRLHVVIDPGNGTGGLFAPRLLSLWGHQMTGIHLEPDSHFPNHLPNPQEPENMHDLSAKVREVGADIGIAFDGDADRMGAVDEKGQMIAADRILALLAQDLLRRHPGAGVVGEVLCSQVLFDTVKTAGGVAHLAPSGHALVKQKLHDTGSLLAGEMSGHIFMAEDYLGFDDGYFVAGRVLQLLASSDQPLSQLDAALPRLYSTPEYRPRCPDDLKAEVIRQVGEALKHHGEVNTIDGVRIQFAKGWGILRASNTEPVLSLRFEGQTEADALAIRALFFDALKAFPQIETL